MIILEDPSPGVQYIC